MTEGDLLFEHLELRTDGTASVVNNEGMASEGTWWLDVVENGDGNYVEITAGDETMGNGVEVISEDEIEFYFRGVMRRVE